MENNIKQQCCIAIPVYKTVPDQYEKFSLEQCASVLYSHQIILFGPEELDCKEYLKIFSEAKFLKFNKNYFASQKTYNRLMLSLEFYEKLNDYEYILIYQPDAYVFKDELNDWCEKGYDYIGAPWFKNFNEEKIILEEPWGVGNGGFSLRKVQSFINILEADKMVKNENEILNNYLNSGFKNMLMKFPDTLLKLSGKGRKSKEFIRNFPVNEDYFWGHYAPKIDAGFKVASIDEAIKFAFECSPSKLFERNNKQLPFGCHAWWKYDLEFWKPFIKKTQS